MILDEIKQRYNSDPVLSQSMDLAESDLLTVMNCAYIARRFFGKSRSWFYQRIHHNIINGKPAQFTSKERKILANALMTLALELMDLSDQIES